ncbi:WxL domain-containing protein [Dellaglioa sp. BT-FLS60]
MKNVLTSALLSATILGAGLAVSGQVSADKVPDPATTTTGVQFKAGDDNTVIPPVDPTNPTDPTDPGDGTGNSGALAIIWATKAISFGTENEIKTTEDVLPADKDVAVEVGDVRGTDAGWNLSVKSDQLTGDKGELAGAVLSLDAGSNVVASGTSAPATTDELKDTTTSGVVLSAAKGTGAGTNVDTIDKAGVKLTVPAGSAEAGVAYSSTLTWTLASGPKA